MANENEGSIGAYRHPARGWGAVSGAVTAFGRQHIPLKLVGSFRTAIRPGGFDCPGCAFLANSDGS